MKASSVHFSWLITFTSNWLISILSAKLLLCKKLYFIICKKRIYTLKWVNINFAFKILNSEYVTCFPFITNYIIFCRDVYKRQG